ncbi:transporter substrate-binding domain-containing protein [Mitsuaria sp. GD03876]|uniref:substrate-binding periplasmic protein n=1 Tax=Mitsuaria sp. GD03876 TaxID=2975399 RepID=UPI00244D4A76|nr:transporter substrate-binding domain-containing protein [Mitsuaria sp. GD03876]MDH0863498.1 transporter substrate-binding domain-containing protein [Mitsuaria sp. GD03876]
MRRRAVVLAPLLGLLTRAKAAPSSYPLALPEGINLPRIKPVLDLIGKQAELTWDYQLVPVTRMLAMVENGWTLGFGAGRSSVRSSRLLFSDEVFTSGLWPIARTELDRELRSVDDLKDLRVCLVRGLDYGRVLEDAKGAVYAAEYVSGDFRTRVRQLMAGRCDVLLANHFNADAGALRQRIAESGGSLDRLKVSAAPLGNLAERFVTAKASSFSTLLPVIDQVLKGSRKEIAQLLASRE